MRSFRPVLPFLLASLSALAVTACGGPSQPANHAAAPDVEAPQASATTPDQPAPQASQTVTPPNTNCGAPHAPTAADAQTAAKIDAEADVIFTGEVVELGAEPTFLSGVVPATQTVTVKLTAVEKGNLSVGDALRVDVVVVGCAPFVTSGANGIPALDKAALGAGCKVRLSAMRVDGGHLRGWRMIAG